MGKSIGLALVTFTFVGCLGIWMGGCQTPEQKVEKLISKLQNKNPKNRQSAEAALTKRKPTANSVAECVPRAWLSTLVGLK